MFYQNFFTKAKSTLFFWRIWLPERLKERWVLKYILDYINYIIHVKRYMKKNYFVVSIETKRQQNIQNINFQYFIYYWQFTVIIPKIFVVIRTASQFLEIVFVFSKWILLVSQKNLDKATARVYQVPHLDNNIHLNNFWQSFIYNIIIQVKK